MLALLASLGLATVDSARLWGRGLSVIDVHLLGSALLDSTALWTRDERLRTAATALGTDMLDG